MFAYHTPGLYVELADDRPAQLVPLRTDVAGFVGIAARGPGHKPIKIESWTQFVSVFGAHIPQGYLAYAVEGFFANGGRTCWVVRAVDPAMARPAQFLLHPSRPEMEVEQPPVLITARFKGELAASVVRTGDQRFILALTQTDGTQEIWRNLTLLKGDLSNVKCVLNDERTGSRLVRAVVGASAPDVIHLDIGQTQVKVGGKAGLATLTPLHLMGGQDLVSENWGLAALKKIDEVSMVAIPDIMEKPVVVTRYRPPVPRCDRLDGKPVIAADPVFAAEFPPSFTMEQIHQLQRALVTHCEHLRDRVAILDIPSAGYTATGSTPASRAPEEAQEWREDSHLNTSYAAFYYPWIFAPDPLQLEGLVRVLPPSGHVAGIYARSDLTIGVHKAPANEAVTAAKDVAALVDEVDHGNLNKAGINVLRTYRGRGVRVMGARTLTGDAEWRYVNVRRLLLMIEESIEEQLQWTVFEPNNPKLWGDIERVVRSFLDNLWRQGMLDGATAVDAYRVQCDRVTNPPEQTDLGMVVCLIGVQPPWPAEFVIVRIGMTEGQTEFSETGDAAARGGLWKSADEQTE